MEQLEKQTIEEVLLSHGKYIGPTVGVSMLPMLKNRRDTIVVEAKKERLQRLDVALYRRGEAYVLHRVLQPVDGGYIIRGDNCYADENVPEGAVIGVLTEFFRKGKHFYCTDKKYIKYAEKRLKTYKTRRFFVLLKTRCRNGAKRVLYAFGLRRKSKYESKSE